MKKEVKELTIKLLITACIAFVLLVFFIGVHVNHSNNMAPALRDGDLVITTKMGKIHADTVVYTDRGFGRILGVPGDIIYIDEDKFTINGNVVQEYVFFETSPGTIMYPYEVPDGMYFVLNDNRDDLNDSRTLGAINKEDIEGTVYLTIRRRGF